MSHYLISIGESLAIVLERAAKAQPEQFAGYVANIDFWFDEYRHLVSVSDGYTARRQEMQTAYSAYAATHGGPSNLDDTCAPYQGIVPTSSPHDRHEILNRNRDALARIVRRALSLELIDYPRHDELLESIGASKS